MTEVSLLHVPEGDRNPYDPVPWSRHPLEPTTNETIAIGVRHSGDADLVTVEWRSSDGAGSLPLEVDNDIWSGRIGPFASEGAYRFVARNDTEQLSTSEWFTIPITRWDHVVLTAVSRDDGRIRLHGDGVKLTLTPTGEDTIRWKLDIGSPPPTASPSVEISGWEAEIEGHTAVISRENDRLVLSIDKAETSDEPSAWRLSWQLESDEKIFGTGERFDALDQRGKCPDIRVYEQYKQQAERTYFPAPWILSSNGYGLAIDGAARVSFDLGATESDRASATIPSRAGASGTWYFGSPKKIIQAYTGDVGRSSAVPLWAYGPWMSGNEWDSDQRIREVVERTLAEEIPSTVIVIEAWSDESTFYLFNDTRYEPVPGAEPVPSGGMHHKGKWPDPKKLVQWLHQHGIRILLWQIPVLKDTDDHEQQLADLIHAETEGLCVGTTDGGTYRNRGWWFPNSRIIDFTNPKARKWWFDKRSYLLDDIGVDGFKTDGGEHLWGTDVSTFDGATAHEAANSYPTHYLGAYHEFMNEHGRDEPLTFSRAGFTGSQSFPAHWAGDEDSTWEAFRASLTAGLSAGASGVAFWSWDLAGFSKELPSAELYKRSTAAATFMPIMQYHSEHNDHRLPLADRTPWNVAEQSNDDNVKQVYKYYARLRMNLIPYLLTLGTTAVQTGIPLMRAMALEFPSDSDALGIDDQFLLGSDILVAPVTTPGTTERRVYIPEGDWWELWSGQKTQPGWTTAATPVDRIPVYVRGGACIPLWMSDEIKLGSPVDLPGSGSGNHVLMVFAGSAARTLTDPLTLQEWTAEVAVERGTFTISTTNAPPGVTVWLRGGATLGPERHVEIPAGSARTVIESSHHD